MAIKGRITLFFSGSSYGWTETYFTTADNLDIVKARGILLRDQRSKLLGGRTRVSGMRVSDDDVFRDSLIDASQVVVGTSDDDGEGLAFKAPAADNPYSAVLLRCESGPLYRKAIYLRGVPDAYIRFDTGFDPPKTWLDRFELFKKVLIGSAPPNIPFQFKVRSHEADNPEKAISNMTFAAGVTTVTTAVAHGALSGDAVLIRKVKNDGTKVNGRRIVDKVSDTVFTLRNFAGDPGYLSGGVLRVERYILTDITSCQVVRQISRRTGRPFDSPRGRRSVRR